MTDAPGSLVPHVTLPVHWLLPTGERTEDTMAGEPCIPLGISFKKPEPRGVQFFVPDLVQTFGLIDTGASWNLVDEQLVRQYSSPPLETLKNVGVTGSEIITNHAVTLMLYGREANMTQNTGAGTINLAGRIVPWRILLGRKFLQMCRFTYNGTRGFVEMTFFADPAAR